VNTVEDNLASFAIVRWLRNPAWTMEHKVKTQRKCGFVLKKYVLQLRFNTPFSVKIQSIQLMSD